MPRGQKVSRLPATSFKILVASTYFLSHWRPVSRNFGPCRKSCPVPCIALLFVNHGFDKLATQAKARTGRMKRNSNLTSLKQR